MSHVLQSEQPSAGIAGALQGRKADAIAEGRRGAELWPISRDGIAGGYVQLQPLLKLPFYLSSGWLRIDPTWARG